MRSAGVCADADAARTARAAASLLLLIKARIGVAAAGGECLSAVRREGLLAQGPARTLE
jgi:hypothetical protein